MLTLIDPLSALRRSASYFLATPRLRMLVVAADDSLRAPALDTLSALDFGAGSGRLSFRLEQPYSAEAPAWKERARSVIHAYEAHRESWSAAGITAPALSVSRSEGDLSDVPVQLELALEQVSAVVGGHVQAISELICVLSPQAVASAERLAATLVGLATAPKLTQVRWVVVDGQGQLATATVEAAENRVPVALADCKLDGQARRNEMTARLAAAATNGRTGPASVLPPPRPGKRALPRGANFPAEVSSQASKLEAAARLGQLAQSAAHAAATESTAEAVRLQKLARDHAFDVGLDREAVTMELLLGTYEMQLAQAQGGGLPTAIATFRRAYGAAERHSLPAEAAQAALGLGQLLRVAGDLPKCIAWYVRAGSTAGKHGNAMLAIEAFRVAGQIAQDAGNPRAALKIWQRALDVAAQAPSEVLEQSSIDDVTRLVKTCSASRRSPNDMQMASSEERKAID